MPARQRIHVILVALVFIMWSSRCICHNVVSRHRQALRTQSSHQRARTLGCPHDDWICVLLSAVPIWEIPERVKSLSTLTEPSIDRQPLHTHRKWEMSHNEKSKADYARKVREV